MRQPLPRVGQGKVLADWITESLREAILKGHFEPGERLDQDLIAAEYGVSRTPIREAARRLEFEGFVVVRPHCGATIAMVSRQDIRHIYEVRLLLEPTAVRQATPRIPEGVLTDLARALGENRHRIGSGDTTQQVESAFFFHETLLDHAENPLFRQTVATLTNRINLVWSFAQLQSEPAVAAEPNAEHEEILEALRQRDAERAAILMQRHLHHSMERIQHLLG